MDRKYSLMLQYLGKNLNYGVKNSFFTGGVPNFYGDCLISRTFIPYTYQGQTTFHTRAPHYTRYLGYFLPNYYYPGLLMAI